MDARKKKKLVMISALIPLIAIGGYTALWFSQANIAKTQIIALIKKLNADREIITYQSIETTGFPSSLIVRIEKPSLSIPVSDLMKPFGQALPIAPDGTDQANMRKALLEAPDWLEELSLDGNISLIVNALSNTYRITATGNSQGQSKIGESIISYRSEFSDGTRVCEMAFRQANSGSALKLWNWEYLNNPQAALQSLRKIDCRIPAVKSYVDQSTTAGYNSEPITMFFENIGSGDDIDAHVKLDFPNYSGTKELDTLLEHYFKGIYPEEELPKRYRMSALGNQKLLLDASVAFNSATPESAPIKINVRDLTYVSAISENRSSLLLESGGLSTGGKISWDVKSDNSFKEPAYHSYIEEAGTFAKQMYRTAKADSHPLTMSEDIFVSGYQSLVPKVHELGTLKFIFTGNGELKQGTNMPVALTALSINTEPYGVEASGKGEIASAMMPTPTGEYQLKCRNCFSLVDDVAAWMQKLQPLLREIEGDSYLSSIAITPESIAGIKQFLQKLDPNGTETLLTYAIKLAPSGEVSINETPLQEVAALFEENAGKILNAGLPPAAASTEATSPSQP
jgi:hypothetical protein